MNRRSILKAAGTFMAAAATVVAHFLAHLVSQGWWRGGCPESETAAVLVLPVGRVPPP